MEIEEALEILKQEESEGRRYKLVNEFREDLIGMLEELRERRSVERLIEDREKRYKDIEKIKCMIEALDGEEEDKKL